MNTTLHPLAEDYLRRLEQVSWPLPGPDRAELLAEIRGHLEAGLTPGSSDADVRNLLDELGAAEDIVSAAQSTPDGAPVTGMPTPAPQVPVSPWGALEIVAVLALTLGTFVVPIIGPIIGIVLVWGSTRWTHREKTVATILTVLPVVVLAVGAIGLLSVRSDGTDQPVPLIEQAPVATESGAHS